MDKEFRLPDLGEGLTSATLRDWHVSAGQSVTIDQKLCSVETSKAIVDIPVPFSGQLVSLSVKEGITIATGDILCTIIPETQETIKEETIAPKTQEDFQYKIDDTPLQAQNILKHSTQGMSKNRADMFDNLARAHLQIATATLTESAHIKKKASTANLVWALKQTLKKHKIFNASYNKKTGLIYFDEIDIGLAIQGDNGLFRVSINNVNNMNLSQLESELEKIKNKQWSNNSSKARMTLSNIGSTGIGLYATPSIMPPGLATIAIGRADIKPVWDETTERWQPTTCLPISLSFDHRIITGVEAAEFLRTFMSQLI